MPERAVHKKLQDICKRADSVECFVEIKDLTQLLNIPCETIMGHLRKLADLEFVEVQGERVRLTMTGRLCRVDET